MTLCVRAKVLFHVWSYDFYDTTLSTELQRRHVIMFFKPSQCSLADRSRAVLQLWFLGVSVCVWSPAVWSPVSQLFVVLPFYFFCIIKI